MQAVRLNTPSVLASVIAAAWLCVSSHAASAQESRHPVISFSVQKQLEENVEGPDVERTYFMVGTKRIVFGVPKGCHLSVDGNGFVLSPAEAGLDGVIHVSRSAFTPETNLAQNALQYREAAAANLPQGVEGVEVQPPVMDPYPYNGWKSLGFVWNYSFYGRLLHRTVSYINLQVGTQVMVTTESGQKDAEKVDKIAHQFMSSWWVMESEAKK